MEEQAWPSARCTTGSTGGTRARSSKGQGRGLLSSPCAVGTSTPSLVRGSSARSLVTTIGDASSAPVKKRARASSAAPTPAGANIKLQSVTVAALPAHEQPPGPMQTSDPCISGLVMPTMSQSPWSSGATERSNGASSGSGYDGAQGALVERVVTR